jgi:hypothetical protein
MRTPDTVGHFSKKGTLPLAHKAAAFYTAEEEGLIAQASAAIESGADSRQTRQDLCARLGRSKNAIHAKLRKAALKQGRDLLSAVGSAADAAMQSQSSTAGSEVSSTEASASSRSAIEDDDSGSVAYASAVSEAGDAGQDVLLSAVSEAGNAGEDDQQNAGQRSDRTESVHGASASAAAAAPFSSQERVALWPVTVEDLQRMSSHLAQRLPSPQQVQADASSVRQDQPEGER